MAAAPPQPFRVFGHRGAAAVLPENTLAGFARALADGADALETDVHATADGVLVCSHDADGQRMAGVGRRVRDATLAEVRSWDAGWGFTAPGGSRPFAGQGLGVPTFEELLATFPGVPMSVDLKARAPVLAASLVELIQSAGAEMLVTIGSFHGRVVRAVRRLGYAGPTALTVGEVRLVVAAPGPAALVRRLLRGSAAMIPRRAGPVRLDGPGLIGRLRRLGLRADYWVVNDPAVARDLVRRGATGLVSDDPARVIGALRRCAHDSETL